MVVWEANGASSVQIDVYSTSHNTPATVSNTYTTTFTFDAVSTQFITRRNLTASGSDHYTIPLGQNINMVYAFNPSSSKFQNHGKNYGYFTIKLNSDGSCGGGSTGGGGSMNNVSAVHGWIMWASWTCIGLL
jgi:hypothetical protein